MNDPIEPQYYPVEDGIPFPEDFEREHRFEVLTLNFWQNIIEILPN